MSKSATSIGFASFKGARRTYGEGFAQIAADMISTYAANYLADVQLTSIRLWLRLKSARKTRNPILLAELSGVFELRAATR
jgi:hypothetical protein